MGWMPKGIYRTEGGIYTQDKNGKDIQIGTVTAVAQGDIPQNEFIKFCNKMDEVDKENKQMENKVTTNDVDSGFRDAWNEARINYQKRYYNYCISRDPKEYREGIYDGHAEECAYVLCTIFGLTEEQLEEIHNTHGYTNNDWGINI